MKRAPLVSEFPTGGMHAVYHFVVQDASTDDKVAFLGDLSKHSFGLVPMTFNLNGKDTLFAQGAGVLKSQAEVDAEFELACSIRRGIIELTNVRYNATDGSDAAVQLR